MIILGIESSCDETAAAIVEGKGSGSKAAVRLLGHAMFSQIETHRKTGGVVPEVAAREHAVKIVPIITAALKNAKLKLHDVDAIAVTKGPGLISSLLVGTNAASTLAAVLNKPLIPVNHIEGHIYANFLREEKIKFPAAVLTVSGGHNELLIWEGHGKYKFLGSTLDDAAGEAFDKVARMIGLPYPGGPAIQKLAERGNPENFSLPHPFLTPWNLNKNKFNWDFSFSGLKTAVLYGIRKKKQLTPADKADIAASFQNAVCEVLSEKLIQAAVRYKVTSIHIAGGVSANSFLRAMIEKKVSERHTQIRTIIYPKNITLCTDNAIMIAVAGFFKYQKYGRSSHKKFAYGIPVIADPNLSFKNW
ncbi:MAG: tRNA (adenosine(37)-N6)-threonylcarbamoyltransferase complex transferase subunit TsaD [Patescibacteria group bacterium]